MSDSPASPTPYEILGVSPTVNQSELRRAYRRLLRQTHPDTGGSSARFNAVQRAWERIGEPAARARYDSQAGPWRDETITREAQPKRRGHTTRGATDLRARAYGHPGGFARERYLTLIREWAGRGVTVDDPYAAALVRSAPYEVRHWLSRALAQEAVARAVSTLGIGYTVWSDVAVGDHSIDHIVLGPAGLFAITAEDWGAPVRVLRGELDGSALGDGERPMKSLVRNSRALGRTLRVRFTAVLVVVPDDHAQEPVTAIGRKRDAALVRLSVLPKVLRDGMSGGPRTSIGDVFEIRTRLMHGIRFV